MFRRDPEAVAQWSAEAPARCHERQMEILEDAARCLRGGGTLVYSTCTFNRVENEGTIEAFLRRHPEFSLDPELALPGIPCQGGMAHLYPHQVRGGGTSWPACGRAARSAQSSPSSRWTRGRRAGRPLPGRRFGRPRPGACAPRGSGSTPFPRECPTCGG